MKDYNEIVRDVLRRSAEEEKENRKKKRNRWCPHWKPLKARR